MRQIKHWQDGVNAVLGAWLVLSPWVLGFAAETLATGNAVIVGIALIAAALGAMFMPRAWEEWSEFVLGLWLIASPWALGFSGIADAKLAAVATGLVIALLSLWTLATDKDYRFWGHERTAP